MHRMNAASPPPDRLTLDSPLQAVLDGLRFNNVRIPTLPGVALRVRKAVAQADVSVEALAAELGRDAALAARLIRVANSPLVRARSEIRSLPQAIMRLGMDYIRDLVTAFALESAFQPRNPAVARILGEVWGRGKEVAAISAALAKRCGRLPGDQALLAGLVHRIGALPLLAEADERPELLKQPAELLALIDEAHAELGSAILQAWHFPRELALVPGLYRDPQRGSADGLPDLADVVAVASLIVASDGLPPERQPLWSELASVKRLGLAGESFEGFSRSQEAVRSRAVLV
jgi:HD-like signal output (HDOD) protein